MQSFILRENIHRFEAMLHSETDPKQRALLESLLAAERAKLAVHDDDDVRPRSEPSAGLGSGAPGG